MPNLSISDAKKRSGPWGGPGRRGSAPEEPCETLVETSGDGHTSVLLATALAVESDRFSIVLNDPDGPRRP